MAAYRVNFRKRASKEYIETIIWYRQHSLQAAEKFVLAINNIINSISANPYSFRNSYKEFFEVKTKKYPLALFILLTNQSS